MTTAPKQPRPGQQKIRQLPSGLFQARVTAQNVDGRRTTRAKSFPSRAEAKAWLTEQAHAKLKGERVGQRDSGQTLLEWLVEFYTQHQLSTRGGEGGSARRLSPGTIQEDLALVQLYVGKRAKWLADTPLRKLKTEDFARFYRQLATSGREDGTPLAKGTVARLHRILRARLAFAVALGRLRVVPMTEKTFTIEGAAKRPRAVLSAVQARALLEVALPTTYGAFFAALLFTGCRPGEMAMLKWEDVDLEAGVLTVRRSLLRLRANALLQRTKDEWREKSTKTERNRTLALPHELVEILRAHRVEQLRARLQAGGEIPDLGLVFTSPMGQPLRLNIVAARHLKPLLPIAAARCLGRDLPPMPRPHRFAGYRTQLAARRSAEAEAMRDAAFPDLSLYGFRHTNATLLMAGNVHPKIVSDRLGHSKVGITLDTYSHTSVELQEKAVAALDGVLGAPTPRRRAV